MKKYVILLLLFVITLTTFAQTAKNMAIDQAFRESTVQELSKLIIDRYVFPDVAEQTAAHLQSQLKAGAFDQYTDLEAFAGALTKAVQSVNHDKHMRINPARLNMGPNIGPDDLVDHHLEELYRNRGRAGGFAETKLMEGNVGYVDFRGFAAPEVGGPVADSYMNLLSGADAIIIDLRKNGGGSPEMVQYLCSYFFDEKLHLNSLYWREGDRTEEFWTLEKVNGKKLPDVPLFVLTSSYTFSGAEEFCYNMQTRKRATLVGETTGGGANPGGGFPVNDRLMVFVPTGKAVNPVTGINWEGTGVEPEVKVPAEEALDKAHELAKIAAEKYRTDSRMKTKTVLDGFKYLVDNYEPGKTDDKLYETLKECVKKDIFKEWHINRIGYFYMQHDMPKVAEAMMAVNTRLFPESANTYDSYGEVLANNGKYKASLEQYRKAVETAKANDDQNLSLFMDNLAKAETIAKDKP